MSVLRNMILYIKIFDIRGMSMLIAPEKELTKKYRFSHLMVLEHVEQLEKEEELLSQKKEKLMDAEQQLWVRISNALHYKIQRNKELKEEVELLGRKCEELTEILNRLSISEP